MVRKTVTVLFADVTGSTAMGERLDPEALRRTMTRYFEVSRATLERHGATVEKFIGDAVMAVFGVPAVHEDDALRAARAALELREGVAALGLELRIGLNTGEVVAEPGETLVTGDAVNVAARLEQAAQAGEILLGDSTYRLAPDALRVEPVAAVEARGKADPVPAWRLVGVLDDTPAFTRRLDAPFVGRRAELGVLTAAFDDAVASSRAHRVTLLGVPGIGKSRLARELVQQLTGRARVAVGRCLAYGEGITYWPLAEIVRGTAGAERDAIASVAGDELVADRLAAAIGSGGAAGSKEETQWAARQYLETLAAERPLLVVLDDLHWAEPTFLDLVEYVADFGAAPILLLCTARPDLLDHRQAWTAPRPNAAAIVLEPLPSDDAALLAGEVDEETRRRILEVAEGNPLFVEQLAALRADAGGDLEMPPSLQALLAARIDSLLAPERAIVECASVEGRLFHRGSVAELVGENVRGDVGAHLLALVRKELVRPDRAQVRGDDGYRFAHALVRDAAYEAISKELRADLHERFAARVERIEADHIGGLDEEIVAYHLEQAARYRRELGLPDTTGQRAGELLARPGTRAFDRGDVSAARNLLGRAVALLSPGDVVRVRALPLLGAATLEAATGMEDVLAILEQALAESRAAGDRVAEATAWAVHALAQWQSVPSLDLERIQREVDARTPEIERLGDARALVCLRRVELALAVTRVEAVDTAAERLLAASRAAGDSTNGFEATFYLSAWAVFGPMPVADALAPERLTRLRADAEGPAEQAVVEHMAGLLHGMRGSLDEGLEEIRKARRTFGELGLRLTAVSTARDEGLIARYAGDGDEGARVLGLGCDELRAAGETGYLSLEVGELADALYRLGRYDEADAAARESESLAQSDDVLGQVVWRRVRAKLLARQGERDEAVRVAREAIERSERIPGMIEPLGDAWRDLAEVERITGHAEAVEGALERALAAYERKGLVPMAARTRAELAELRAAVH